MLGRDFKPDLSRHLTETCTHDFSRYFFSHRLGECGLGRLIRHVACNPNDDLFRLHGNLSFFNREKLDIVTVFVRRLLAHHITAAINSPVDTVVVVNVLQDATMQEPKPRILAVLFRCCHDIKLVDYCILVSTSASNPLRSLRSTKEGNSAATIDCAVVDVLAVVDADDAGSVL